MENKTYGNCIITKAVIFAAEKHHGTIRKGSEENPLPYIVHPMEAATIAATMTNDPNVIAAALLHDVVEDTDVSIETIKAEFNDIYQGDGSCGPCSHSWLCFQNNTPAYTC